MKALSKMKWGLASAALMALSSANALAADPVEGMANATTKSDFMVNGVLDHTAMWNELWHEMLFDITLIGVVFGGAALIMLFVYRAKNANEVGRAPKLSKAQAISWALIPAALFMADDFFLAAKGWTLWNAQRGFPEDALEVKVSASQWMWAFEYENGAYSDNYPTPVFEGDDGYDPSIPEQRTYAGEGLVVPAGTPVMLRMDSSDVIHSFGVSHYRMTEDVMPGRVTYLWFIPREEEIGNSYPITCREYCGKDHSQMVGYINVVSQSEFDNWAQENADARTAKPTKDVADGVNAVPATDPKA